MNHLYNLLKMHGISSEQAQEFAQIWALIPLDVIQEELNRATLPLWALSSLSCYLNLLTCDAGALRYD